MAPCQLKFIVYFLSFYLLSSVCSTVLPGTQYYIYLSHLLRLLSSVTVSQPFLDFDDLDSFKAYWSNRRPLLKRIGVLLIVLISNLHSSHVGFWTEFARTLELTPLESYPFILAKKL